MTEHEHDYGSPEYAAEVQETADRLREIQAERERRKKVMRRCRRRRIRVVSGGLPTLGKRR